MQSNREQYYQPTRQQNPELVNIDTVRGGQMMPQQNGQPAQYGQPNPYAQPNQYGQPMQMNRTVPQGQPTQIGQNPNTLLPEHVPDKQFSLKCFAPMFAGIIGLLTIGRFSGSLAAMSLGFGIMGTCLMTRKEMEDYKPERKFKAMMGAVGCGLFGLAGLVTLFAPSLTDYAAGATLTLAGLFLTAAPPIARHMKLRRCTEKTRAVCIGNREKRSSGKHHRMMYAPIWQYIAGGRAYTAYDDVYTSPQQFYEGEGTDIMVNPNDPRDFFRGSDPSTWALMGFGILMLGGGIIVLLRLLGIL